MTDKTSIKKLMTDIRTYTFTDHHISKLNEGLISIEKAVVETALDVKAVRESHLLLINTSDEASLRFNQWAKSQLLKVLAADEFDVITRD